MRRIHRHDSIAVVLHVLRGEIAGPVPVRRQSHHRNDARAGEYSADAADIVDEFAHAAYLRMCTLYALVGSPIRAFAIRILMADPSRRGYPILQVRRQHRIITGPEGAAFTLEIGVTAEHPVATLD